ncbi:MAG: glycosyltransferase [Oligoflexales bacterium]
MTQFSLCEGSNDQKMTQIHVYWDLYGKNYPSGVVQCAKNLAISLENLGIHPKIPLFDRYEPISPLNPIWIRSFGPASPFLGQKAIWPCIVSRKLRHLPQGVFHGLSNMNVPLDRAFHKRFASVLTVHDVIPLLAPESVSLPFRLQTRLLFPRALQAVEKIVCVSEWTKRTLLHIFPFIKEKVVVIPNGFPALQAISESERAARLETKQLLSVSRFEKYKRFDLLVSMLRAAPSDWCLTVVTDQRGEAFFFSEAGDLLANRRLVVKKQLAREQLDAEYRSASIYVHPSLYEGFCLPASEALAFGLPVVYTKGNALDEFMNDAFSVGVEAHQSVTKWLEATENAWSKNKKPQIAQQLQAFFETVPTWEKSAKKLLTLYQNLIK